MHDEGHGRRLISRRQTVRRGRHRFIMKVIAKSKPLALTVIFIALSLYILGIVLTVTQTNNALRLDQVDADELDTVCNRIENIYLTPFSVREEGRQWEVCYWRYRNTYIRLLIYCVGASSTLFMFVMVLCGKVSMLRKLARLRSSHLCFANMIAFMTIIDLENAYTGYCACHYRFLSGVGDVNKIIGCSPWPFVTVILVGCTLFVTEGIMYTLIRPYYRNQRRRFRIPSCDIELSDMATVVAAT